MTRFAASLLIVLLTLPAGARAASTFTEGTDYVRVSPVQQTTVPKGKIEVLEVFSYGCPVCNAFRPVVEQLRHSLPPNAQLAFLPAAFNTAEDWPMFQRAYFATQLLGITERTHQAMFDAVWRTGELAISDYDTHRLKSPPPSIEQAAAVCARAAGVPQQQFLAMANSFAVDSKMRAADAQIQAMQVSGTPTIVVNGKYRVTREDWSKNTAQFIELVKYLVAKESGGG